MTNKEKDAQDFRDWVSKTFNAEQLELALATAVNLNFENTVICMEILGILTGEREK